MRYADVIWGSLSDSRKESLQRLQEKVISINGTSRIQDESSNNFLGAEQLIIFDRAVMAYKIVNRLCPENLWNKLLNAFSTFIMRVKNYIIGCHSRLAR